MNTRKLFLLSTLFVFLLLAGCGTVEFEQQLYRDGTFDFTMRVTSSNDMFISLLQEGIDMENASVTELDNGFEYRFEGLTLDDEFEGNIAQAWTIERSYSFPHQYITIRFSTDVLDTDEEDDMFGMMTPELLYTINPFGRITETNGVLSSDSSKVTFDLGRAEDYHVTFRHLCLFRSLCSRDIQEQEATEPLDFDLGVEESAELDPFGDEDFFGGDFAFEMN